MASSDVRIVYSSAGLYTVLQNCIRFCRIVYGSAGLYTVLRDCIQFCRIVSSSAGLYTVLQDFALWFRSLECWRANVRSCLKQGNYAEKLYVRCNFRVTLSPVNCCTHITVRIVRPVPPVSSAASSPFLFVPTELQNVPVTAKQPQF